MVFLRSAFHALMVPIGFSIANRVYDGTWPILDVLVASYMAALAVLPWTKEGAREDAKNYGVIE